MNETAITEQIVSAHSCARIERDGANLFFFAPGETMFPFATLVTSDQYDAFSQLNRPDVFRLNLGLSRETFRALFPEDTAHDHTELDRLMPHPVYAGMFWVCVLNPGEATAARLPALIQEAYQISAARAEKKPPQT